MSFGTVLAQTPLVALAARALAATGDDVARALNRPHGERTVEDFATLIGPAAGERLEDIARAARDLTLQRFGRTVHMYAPLYLSNECLTTCTYCGFAKGLPIARKTLGITQSMAEGRYLHDHGFRSVLLLTGEHQKNTGVDFLCEHVRSLRALFAQIALEVQVWSEDEYRRLAEAGCDGVVIYQETYNRDEYARVHVGGRKRDYDWRLEGPERAARAGIRRLGVGALLGLHEPWREDAIAVAAHARYLQHTAWRQEVTVSLPRIRPSASGYAPNALISDRELAQLVCAFRLVLPDAGIVMSARESAELRDHLVPLGVTHTSAGSHTDPGGYTEPGEADAQFEVSDTRSPGEVASALRAMGYEPVWKDWDPAMRASGVAGAAAQGAAEQGAVAPVAAAP